MQTPVSRQRRKQPDNYDKSVFINCPFDTAYDPFYKALIFTVEACGYSAHCGRDVTSRTERFLRIQDIIGECRYSIHDLSRNVVGEEIRFNMPLELGVFIGCKTFGKSHDDLKDYLVLDKDKYYYREYISDLGSIDPEYHEGKIDRLIGNVRKWLSDRLPNEGLRNAVPSAKSMVALYEQFQSEAPGLCQIDNRDWDFEDLTFIEYKYIVQKWWYDKLTLREGFLTATTSKGAAREVFTKVYQDSLIPDDTLKPTGRRKARK